MQEMPEQTCPKESLENNTKKQKMIPQQHSSILHKKGRASKPKVCTVEIGLKDKFFFTVPKGYLMCLNWLGGTTFSSKLYKIHK